MAYTYRTATLDDLELLTRTRVAVLRAANRLPEATDMGRPLYERFGFLPAGGEMELPGD